MTDILRAAALLRAGELVAFPTETVYGLGADAGNPAAVAKIFAAKGRPADHPLIVHLPDATHLAHWADPVPPVARQLAAAFWPGPLTLILPRAAGVTDAVTGGQRSVGVRVPGHPLALELLAAFGSGIAAPSANRFGRISPTTAQHVRDELGEAVALVLDGGPCEVGIESTILDLSGDTPSILRPGHISAEAIADVIGILPARHAGAGAPRVSGSLEAHYAPRTPMQLVAADGLLPAVRHALAAGERVAVLACLAPAITGERIAWRAIPADPEAYARALYASLRWLDGLGCQRLVVEQPPQTAPWIAVQDRLQRAAAGAGKSEA